MEELGIGRPSTYASIMATIQDRGYVIKRGQALIPSFLAFAVINLMELHFAQMVDYGFTAAMENELDEVAGGTAAAVDFLTAFYFGGELGGDDSVARSGGLRKMVTENLGDIDARGINSIPLFRDPDGRDVVVRVGKYGPYLQRALPGADSAVDVEANPEDAVPNRASLPDGIAPDELTEEKVAELFLGGAGEREVGAHPETGEKIVVKSGRYGPYISTGEKNASLLSTMSPDTLSLADALKLLSLPRVVGVDDAGVEILASGGRYGPYIKRGDDTRSLGSEDELFTVTRDEALVLLAAPKLRGRAAAKPPLRELGVDPLTEKALVIKDGRFGPYVTDGESNASLRRGMSPETMTVEQASEMLSEKRAAGPAPKKKAAAKKAPAKKAAAGATKKTAAAAAKKTAAKKTATATTAAKKTAAAKKAAPKKAAPKKATADS
jgi:DNA topoisomerase-1